MEPALKKQGLRPASGKCVVVQDSGFLSIKEPAI